MFIASEETMYGLMLNGRCFLELWVSSPVSSLTFSLTTWALGRTCFWGLFLPLANHYSVTICCLHSEPLFLPAGLTSHSSLLQLSLTSPLGLSLQAKRSLLPVLFRVPLRGISRSAHLTPVSFPLQAKGGPGGCVQLGLVLDHVVTLCMYAWGI